MKQAFKTNGLIYKTEEEIKYQNYLIEYISDFVRLNFINLNSRTISERVEFPVLMPTELVNSNYTEKDYYKVSDKLILSPETTPSSYFYAQEKLGFSYNQNEKKFIANDMKRIKSQLPYIIWQAKKSFRKEESDAMKYVHMRFNEFYQLEFQFLYTKGSACDYHQSAIEFTKQNIQKILKYEVRSIESDRLPVYSLSTIDIEVKTPYKWLEICSISRRNDFHEEIEVVEIAFGLDRLVGLLNYEEHNI